MPVWKKLKEYQVYSVSDEGDIRNDTTRRILKWYVRNGYKSVSLSKSNIKRTLNIHSLVASHFLDKPSGSFVVNHKDEDKLNNHISNLEYITYAENTAYSSSSTRSSNKNDYDLKTFQDIPHYTNYKVSKNWVVYVVKQHFQMDTKK